MREVFTREIAVEEGLRKDTIIDKGFMKRPTITIYAKKASSQSFDNKASKIKYEDNTKRHHELRKQYDIKSHKEAYRTMFEKNKVKQGETDRLGRKKESLSLLISGKDFKKKTFIVYVEKQHGDICTLRDIGFDEREIFDIKLNEYHDLGGRAVFIDMSRKNGEIEILQVTKLFNNKL